MESDRPGFNVDQDAQDEIESRIKAKLDVLHGITAKLMPKTVEDLKAHSKQIDADTTDGQYDRGTGNLIKPSKPSGY